MADDDPSQAKKLTKKQQKALEFREKKKTGESTEKIKEERKAKKREREHEQQQDQEQQPKKKSRRRGKKSGEKASGEKRYILFIGNLPYNVAEDEIKQHFKPAQPVTIRPRNGFAFAEFSGADAVKRLNIALKLHHTTFNNRKINVELTAGGGGNSQQRKQKLKERNDRLKQELQDEREKDSKSNNKPAKPGPESDKSNGSQIHPDRLRRIG